MTSKKWIRTDKLGLKVGDILTFDDGRTQAHATIDGIREYIIRIIADRPDLRICRIPYSENLMDFTYRLTDKNLNHNQCLGLWQFEGQTLRQCYKSNMKLENQKNHD
ncbi:MAG: hypothetical protein WCP12_16045 [bacterium]